MSQTRSRRWIASTGLALVLVAAIAAIVFARGTPRDVFALKFAPLVRTVQFSARVEALSRVEVGSTLTGRVAQVLVAEGDRVRADDVLIRLETQELQASVDQARASEQQARARLAGLRSTGRAQALAAEAQASASVVAARAEMERAQQLVAQGFVSASRVDETRRALAVAQAQQRSAQAQVAANTDSGSEVVQAAAQLDVARAATAAAQARLAQAVLRAPGDARVLSRAVEPGQIVQPGRALLTLAIDGPTRLVAQADERFLEQLQPGQTAAVLADAYADQRFQARVLTIAPAVDAQRGAIEVTFELLAPPPAFLREDMTLSVEVETARRERALVLPLSAVRQATPQGDARDSAQARSQVLVAVDGRARARDVRLGLRTLDAVEVLQGLAEGDSVILDGTARADERVRARRVDGWPLPGTPHGTTGGGAAGAALTQSMGR